MPFRRKRKATWRARRVAPSKRFKSSRRRIVRRKRVSFRRGGGRVPRNLGLLMPKYVLTKFRAFDTWNIVNSAIATPRLRFYTNNPYDPLHGISTTKCTGFDDLMSLFTFGVCYGCKFVARPIMSTNSGEVVMYYKHSSSVDSDPGWMTLNQITETNATKWRLVYTSLMPGWDVANPRPFSTYVNIKRLEKKKELEASYYFTKSNGPGTPTVLDIGYRHADSSLDPSTNLFTVRTIISVTYYCKLFSKKTMTE